MNPNKYSFHSGKELCINYYIIITAISHQILGRTDILSNNNLYGSDRGSLMTIIWLFLPSIFLLDDKDTKMTCQSSIKVT